MIPQGAAVKRLPAFYLMACQSTLKIQVASRGTGRLWCCKKKKYLRRDNRIKVLCVCGWKPSPFPQMAISDRLVPECESSTLTAVVWNVKRYPLTWEIEATRSMVTFSLFFSFYFFLCVSTSVPFLVGGRYLRAGRE